MIEIKLSLEEKDINTFLELINVYFGDELEAEVLNHIVNEMRKQEMMRQLIANQELLKQKRLEHLKRLPSLLQNYQETELFCVLRR